jgi:uncharacterized membrane protein
MPVFAAWGFETPDGADHAVRGLSQQAVHAQVLLHDAAIVVWPADADAPKALRIRHPRIRGALGRGFWGLLLDTIFGLHPGGTPHPEVPSLRALSGWSIGQEALSTIRARVTPGTSALFVVCRVDGPASLDQLEHGLPGPPSRLCRVELGRAEARRPAPAAGEASADQPTAEQPAVVDVAAAEDRASSTTREGPASPTNR